MEIRVKKESLFGKLLYLCTVKAAIERAKSRMLFELFRAEAGSNVVQFKTTTIMEAITFTPAQVQVFNMVSHIKTAMGLEKLRQQLAAFYAKQIDEEMDALWESGQFDEKRLQELRGSHFRTPYKK